MTVSGLVLNYIIVIIPRIMKNESPSSQLCGRKPYYNVQTGSGPWMYAAVHHCEVVQLNNAYWGVTLCTPQIFGHTETNAMG